MSDEILELIDEDDLTVPCGACGAGIGVPCTPDCFPCVRDDCTDCECPRCQADEARWASWQGWNGEQGRPR